MLMLMLIWMSVRKGLPPESHAVFQDSPSTSNSSLQTKVDDTLWGEIAYRMPLSPPDILPDPPSLLWKPSLGSTCVSFLCGCVSIHSIRSIYILSKEHAAYGRGDTILHLGYLLSAQLDRWGMMNEHFRSTCLAQPNSRSSLLRTSLPRRQTRTSECPHRSS